ncbi:SRPBCC family protein [Streptomyces rugosispiralis]|uniref:SRPBCC family protein n=1 Tax=Streptomyces rugosispiralis TaxID=2967341 RepID=A0ABT1UTF7_9ACTN|nr:SRPBCC family protein [Streptomyces rugosispiralis]MCQ8188402.1 SRPBCC family protein [Streptomyces rugosispiralis]
MAEETKGRTDGRTLARELPTDRLLKEAQGLLLALGERALQSVTHLGNPGPGALKGSLEQMRDKVVDTAKEQMKDQVKGKVKDQVKEKVVDTAKSIIPGLGGGDGDGGGKGGKKLKVTNIVEQMDVGAPLSLTYNLWTEWENFPSYMKKVEDVRNEEGNGDEDGGGTESEWKAQVFWSHRKWRAEVVEQVPDKRIIWTSRADKGHVDGTITFHELAPDLTRILFVLEYYPQGFMERTGNLWRAQGRRVRLEMKHFRRHLMREVLLEPDEVVGWRGVVRDGEIVEDDEREGREREEEEPEQGEEREEPGDEYEDEEPEEPEEPEEYEDEEPRDDYEEEYEDEEPARRRVRR